MKTRRKIIHILVTLSFLLTLLVPMVGPAGAISTNRVSKIASLSDEFFGDTGVTLTIKEDSDFTGDFEDGDIFQLILPEGVNWWKPTVAITGVGTTASVTYDIISDQILEVTITNPDPDIQEAINVTMNVEIDGATGDIAVEVDPLDSGVTGGKYVFARVSGDKTTAKALSVETIGDPGVGGDIRIEELSLDALGYDAQYIKLKLPTHFEWDGTPTVKFSGGFSDISTLVTSSAVGDGEYYIESVDDQTVKIWFNPVGTRDSHVDRTQRGIITVSTPINPDKDANYGEVEVSISGDVADDADVVVAKYADFGVEVSVDEVKEIKAGKFGEELDTITIEENVPGTLVEGRDITLVFPSWVKITDASVNPSGGGLDADVGTVDGESNELDITITSASSGSTGKIEVDLEISVEGNKSGDIEMEVDGSKAGIPEGTKLVVGKAVSLVNASVDAVKDVKIGVQGQEIGDITITELVKEAISDTPNGTINHNVTLTLPEGVWFTSKPKVEVTEGNLDIDEDNITLGTTSGGTADGVLNIPIKGSSTKPSTIKVSGIKLTVDRTAPTGDLMVKVGGGAIIENQKANVGWREGQAQSGKDTVVDPGEFDTGTAVKVKVANIVTPAPGETTGTSVFKIGETSYTLNGVVKTMDVAPYIKNDRTYLPVRFVANAAGVADANIMWNDAEQSVILIKGDRVVKMVIGSNTMYINGVAFTMDVAPEIVDPGRTMLPVRWVAQALGCTVTWDEATQSVTVTQ
ncbi:MAG: copper amine oxidase N-terminal domain-containing protein [Pelotomaculum sp.]|nr:copper amine oxidase N-terminal domain-containing protein [Pelotomaculum sp.]